MLALVPFIPFVGFLINGFWYAFSKKKPAGAVFTGTIASAAIFSSFLISVILFFRLGAMPAESRVIEEVVFSWMHIGSFHLDFALRIDALSSLFVLVITGVGTLIHIYSIGYMGHDESPGKYFSYLNLFCAAMLVLVLGSSLPVMFLGWEGVGLCSYLLIGYWYTDNEKASAGKKAFIVNRIGDFGFLLGMFLIFTSFGTLDFAELKNIVVTGQSLLQSGLPETNEVAPDALRVAASFPSVATITLICLFLFLGCTGKSAQIPLYVWLPDAMAGPTPVSALIHAATMVTSGIYLLARLSFIYVLSPDALMVIAWVGAITAFFAATMAIAQNDIKKVLAYSTVSQLGYMFLACGVAAFSTGVFHVITHAFFKALLFLGAGSVIFGMHHEQDVTKMGGLKQKMPQTWLTFTAGWLAICGILPFAGFFSKDEILWKAFSSPLGSTLLWGLGFLTAIMTAFYMTRLFSLTFLGKYRSEGKIKAHESPKVMVYPLYVLAFLSLAGGFIGIPHFSWLEHWLSPVVADGTHPPVAEASVEWLLMVMSVGVAALVMYFGLNFYKNLSQAEKVKKQWASVYKTLENKWYVDEIYEWSIVKPIFHLSQTIWKVFDVNVIDRIVLGFGRASVWTGQAIRVIQTGSIQVYAVTILIGLVLTLGYLFYGMV